MAEITIILVAQNIGSSPNEDQVKSAKNLFKSFFPQTPADIEVRQSSSPFFVTTRDAFDEIACPSCGETIERFGDDEDHEEWWQDIFLDKTHYADAPDLDEGIAMPCCGEEVKLREINLGGNAVLTNFSMTLRDPSETQLLSEQRLQTISTAVGCDLTQLISIRS